jgi:hypothetical protein
MTIPGRGDLSPRRRSGYGRHRRRWPRVLLVLTVIAALGAGGYFGWRRWHNDDSSAPTAFSPCTTPTAVASPTPPPAVVARVLNGSLKSGLGARIGHTLHDRFGVAVTKVGNAPRFLHGASLVRYPAGDDRPARTLAAMVVPNATPKVDTRLRRIELDVGTAFRRVATTAEFRRAAATPSSTPAPSRTASPSACPSP